MAETIETNDPIIAEILTACAAIFKRGDEIAKQQAAVNRKNELLGELIDELQLKYDLFILKYDTQETGKAN